MNELAMKMEAIGEAVKSSERVLLHCHPNPDPDSYGSALGLAQILRDSGKGVTVIKGDSPIPDFAKFLSGADQVIEKNYLEINPAEYDLFIILDSGALNRISNLGPVTFPSTLKTILIDHHATTESFAQINWIDTKFAATAEMITALAVALHWPLSPAAARCLLVGIYTDTGGFKYPSTTSHTFSVASQLAAIDPNYSEAIFQLENNNTPGSIYFQALALGSISLWGGGRVAMTALSYDQLQQAGVGENDAKAVTVANVLKSVRGWEIGITLYEWRPGEVKLSARTRDARIFDLTKLATPLGGGGHRAAVGAYLSLPLKEAQELVVKTLGQVYPELIDEI